MKIKNVLKNLVVKLGSMFSIEYSSPYFAMKAADGRALVEKAMVFAHKAHITQKRKYTQELYISHCAHVAALVHAAGGSWEMVAAAWLHDVVEDCGVSVHQIREEFGELVASYVIALTDHFASAQFGNRSLRKSYEAERLSNCCAEVQSIKYADLISNTQSIVVQDKKFAKVYLKEKRNILEICTKGNPLLHQMAMDQLDSADKELMEWELTQLSK
jgi:guanosine-3',5'-bis(diphosphate) 3'-pyrophosphohydrolase